MPLDGLDVGSIFADVGFRYDDRGEQAFRRAETKLRAQAARPIEQDFKIKVDADKALARLNTALGNGISETKAFSNVVSTIKFPAMVAGAGIAAQALSALTGGAVSVVSALAPLSGALAAYPALATTYGQAFGVVTLATEGVSDAVGGLNTDLDKSKDAFKNLTAPAQRFAVQLDSMKAPVRDLQRTAQRNLFPGLLEGLKGLSGLLPTLRPIVGATATEIGSLASLGGRLVGTWGPDLETQGRRNVRWIHDLGIAAITSANAIKNITLAAGPLVSWITRGIRYFALLANAQIGAARESGKLAAFFRETRQAMSSVLSIGADLAVAFFNVGKAAKPLGDEVLANLVKAADAFRKWTDSARGQNALARYFADIRPAVLELGRLVRDAGAAFLRLGRGNLVGPLLQTLRREVIPALETVLGSTTQAFGPAIIESVGKLARTFSLLAGSSGPLVAFVQSLNFGLGILNDLLERFPALQSLVVTLAGLGGVAKALQLGAAMTGLTRIIRVVREVRVAYLAMAAGEVAAGAAASGPLAAGLAKVMLLMRTNPFVAVATAALALGTALVVAYKHSESFRHVVNNVFAAVRNVALGFADRFLFVVDKFLWGIQKMAEGASHLPFVGDKFKGVADKIKGARKDIDNWRDSLDDAQKKTRNFRVDRLVKELGDARTALGKTKKGTDEHREAAEKLRKKQDELSKELSRTKNPARTAATSLEGVGKSGRNAAGDVADAVASVGGNLNSALRGMGAKPVSFRITRAGFNRSVNQGGGSDASQRNQGGVASPYGGSNLDDHLLLDPQGRPVARMSGTEGVVNTPQMRVIDHALATTAALGLGGYGSLNELWGSGLRHYEGGGLLEGIHNPGLSIKNGRPVPPSFWGSSVWAGHANHIHVAAQNVMAIARQLVQRFGLAITSTTGGQHAAGSYHYRGLAVDLGGSAAAMNAAARFLAGNSGAFGAAPEVRAPGVRGPAGALRTMIERAGALTARAANARLDREYAADMASTAVGGGAAGTAQMRAWARAGLEAAGVPATAGNVSLIVARMQQESSGNPSAVNLTDINAQRGYPSRGLMQLIPQNFARYHVAGTANNINDPVANVAASVRYMLATYGHLVGSTGRGYRLGGLLRRFARGGHLATSVAGSGGAVSAPFLGGSIRQRTPRERAQRYATSLRPMITDRIGVYEDYRQQVEDLNTQYSVQSRRYDLTDEELIDPDTGAVDQKAVQRRARELGKLLNIRDKIVQALRSARQYASKVAGNYRTILGRIRRSLGHAKGKDRRALRGMERTYRERLAEWTGNLKELRTDTIPNAVLDFRELAKELGEVRGTHGEPRDLGTDPGTDPAGDAAGDAAGDPATAAPTLEQIAAAAIQQIASSTAARSDLFANFGSNFRTAGMGPVTDAGGGTRNYGATGGADAPAAGGGGDQKTIVQNIVIQEPPPDPHIWAKTVGYELATV